MWRIIGSAGKDVCDREVGVTRRDVLRVGGAGMLGLSLGGMLLALWLLRKRLGRGPLVAMLFFGFSLGPMLGFLDFYFMTYSFVADRFQYLASIGPIALGCAAASAFPTASRPGFRPASTTCAPRTPSSSASGERRSPPASRLTPSSPSETPIPRTLRTPTTES